jgi:two-component system response regulator MprA
MRVLIVEDEKKLSALLKKGLESEQWSVTVEGNGSDALELALNHTFDAVLLDVMLPGLNGFEVIKRLREKRNRTPVLMLTARDAASDVITGLNLGADDYLTKPFSFEVLCARLRAVARRGPLEQSPELHTGDLLLRPATQEVRRAGTPIALTRTEYLLLELLLRHAGRVLSRQFMIEQVWGFDRDIENNTLDAFIKKLRIKVDDGHREKLIQTVRGFGYRLAKGGAA